MLVFQVVAPNPRKCEDNHTYNLDLNTHRRSTIANQCVNEHRSTASVLKFTCFVEMNPCIPNHNSVFQDPQFMNLTNQQSKSMHMLMSVTAVATLHHLCIVVSSRSSTFWESTYSSPASINLLFLLHAKTYPLHTHASISVSVDPHSDVAKTWRAK